MILCAERIEKSKSLEGCSKSEEVASALGNGGKPEDGDREMGA
jgi:hypothetical protein